MPRRNLALILVIGAVSFICYQRADSANRARNGRMFETFNQALVAIEAHYVEEVDRRALFESAMKGMVGSLDPYSAFMPPADWTPLRETLEQHFGGIGIEVGIDPETDRLTVLSPLAGTPAYEAGIVAGDVIVAIDGESTDGFQISDARDRIRGPVGSTVTLTVLHEGAKEPVDIEIVRAEIEVASILGDTRDRSGRWRFMLGDTNIAYVRIINFGERTVQEFEEVLTDFEARGVDGLILDLRSNPGGQLESAIGMCDLLLDGGRIVSTRGRDQQELEAWDAEPGGLLLDTPIVVLINKYSASASEIVAACLQDHARAVVMGERSWGKGTVQSIIDLEGGSKLRITTATYWRPSGKNIHRLEGADEQETWGVVPNDGFVIPLTDEQFRELVAWRRQRDVVPRGEEEPDASAAPIIEALKPDVVLRTAVEYLQNAARSKRPALQGAPN